MCEDENFFNVLEPSWFGYIYLVVYNTNKQGQFIFSSHHFVLILRILTSIYAYTVFKNECSRTVYLTIEL